MTTNTLKFLRDYAEQNKDGFKDGVTYVDNRGFFDGFGVEALLEGIAKQGFAREFDYIIKLGDEVAENGDPEWVERIEYIHRAVLRVLTSTLLFNSSSFGSNAMDMYKVREAQKIIEKLGWNRALDADYRNED